MDTVADNFVVTPPMNIPTMDKQAVDKMQMNTADS